MKTCYNFNVSQTFSLRFSCLQLIQPSTMYAYLQISLRSLPQVSACADNFIKIFGNGTEDTNKKILHNVVT